jgi:hypothetical protein
VERYNEASSSTKRRGKVWVGRWKLKRLEMSSVMEVLKLRVMS